jgi:hypothetical protein
MSDVDVFSGEALPFYEGAGVVLTVTLSVPTTGLEVGTTGSASAVVRDALGNGLAGRTVTWDSSSNPVIADPASTTTGLDGRTTISLLALAAGTTTITATCETVASSGIVVTVSAVADPATYSGEGSAQIVITGESRLAGWERPKVRRFNDADQKKDYPTDRFFEGMAESAETEIVWPTAAVLRRSA